jgi:trehalose-6-phosphate synthase
MITSRTWTREILHELIETRLAGVKFIVVSNREPYMHWYGEGGDLECMSTAGGLATALRPIMVASNGTWIAHGAGNADRDTVDERNCIAVPPGDPSYTLRRVWLTRDQEERYYYGFANEGLWPLCHITFTRPIFRTKDWECYQEVNRIFAQAVIEEAGTGPAIVFIQDYHFCLLPRMLKEMGWSSSMGCSAMIFSDFTSGIIARISWRPWTAASKPWWTASAGRSRAVAM